MREVEVAVEDLHMGHNAYKPIGKVYDDCIYVIEYHGVNTI